jgi:AraC-like DNA-binding protein
MSTHRHSFFQFLLVISGELSLVDGQGKPAAKLTRGMASLIPPEFPHSLQTRAGYRQFGINMVSAAPEERLIKILATQAPNPAVMHIPMLLDIIPEIEDCSRLQTMVSIQKIRNRLEYMLLSCVDMLKKQDGGQAFREKLMAYFRERLSETLTLGDVSRNLSLSPTHVERLSYLEFGCGAMCLFHRLKIDRARTLLYITDLPISVIADHLGYKDQSYFSRYFKKYTGTSPLTYKKGRSL